MCGGTLRWDDNALRDRLIPQVAGAPGSQRPVQSGNLAEQGSPKRRARPGGPCLQNMPLGFLGLAGMAWSTSQCSTIFPLLSKRKISTPAYSWSGHTW